MRLMDIISSVKRPNPEFYWCDLEDISRDLGLDVCGVGEEMQAVANRRLVEAPLGQWRCSDTRVGWNVWLLDDSPVCYSYRGGRKSSATFKWVSGEAVRRTHEFVKSLLEPDAPNVTILGEEALNVDLAPYYTVDYGSQLLREDYSGFYMGEPVEVVQTFWNRYEEEESHLAGKVKVRKADGEEIVIPTADYQIPYKLECEIDAPPVMQPSELTIHVLSAFDGKTEIATVRYSYTPYVPVALQIAGENSYPGVKEDDTVAFCDDLINALDQYVSGGWRPNKDEKTLYATKMGGWNFFHEPLYANRD